MLRGPVCSLGGAQERLQKPPLLGHGQELRQVEVPGTVSGQEAGAAMERPPQGQADRAEPVSSVAWALAAGPNSTVRE